MPLYYKSGLTTRDITPYKYLLLLYIYGCVRIAHKNLEKAH